MSMRAELVEILRLADHDYTRTEKTEHPEGKAGFMVDRVIAALQSSGFSTFAGGSSNDDAGRMR